VASRDNSAAAWTYSTEVSPTGAATGSLVPAQNVSDPLTLLHILVNLQSQQLELLRQLHEMQRQQVDLIKESTHINREQRSRQGAELERWQQAHEPILDNCKDVLSKLEHVHATLMREAIEYVEENHENLMEGDFMLSDFTDRFGPRLAHLNTVLAVLRPLAAAQRKPDETTS
jgi:hypothetical protein